jgi:hypothetical protein
LVVDDNLNASAEEISEAALYAELLAAAGYTAEVWATRTDGLPSVEELTRHSWVIWSDAAYAQSGIQGESLRLLSELINAGGKVTIGSRMPFGVGGEAASRSLISPGGRRAVSPGGRLANRADRAA